jgi:hypothetical protein
LHGLIRYNVDMYIARIPNRSSPPAFLLRESYRQGGKVKNRTLANLSHLPSRQIELLRRVLRGETLVGPEEALVVEGTLPHGHVEAVLGMVRKLGIESLLSSRRSRQRDLVVAMIVARVLFPCSKLATTRQWQTTTLGEELGVADADADELYAALDWLWARQASIEQKLAARHLPEGSLVLDDVNSSYYEGRTCVLARHGHSRDGKKGRPIYHHVDDRVRAHILLCMLAYYVQWHLKEAWAPLLFEEEDLPALRAQRDPVARAEPSPRVQRKKATRRTPQGLPVQSFTTLLRHLATRCRTTGVGWPRTRLARRSRS